MVLRILAAIVFAGVVVGGIVGFNLFRDQMIAGIFADMQPPPVTVATTVATPITWQPGIEAIGTANAAHGVDLAVEAGGVVKEVLFAANDTVKQGQHLVQIDDRIERADLAAAQASLDLSLTELARAETLRERGVTAVTNVDTAQAGATNARSQVTKLTAVLEQKALEAPFAGVIGIPQIDVGQYVVPGTVFATLQDLDTMRVDFSIPEQQIRLISIGLPVTISPEAGKNAMKGTISGIEPKIDPNTRLVTIRAEVDNPGRKLNPGQFLRVRVDLPEEANVMALPQTVVSSNLYGDSVYVVRTEGEGDTQTRTVEQVFVQVGRRSQGLVEIMAGVVPGDEVVTAGQNRLSGGSRVVIDNAVSPVVSPATAQTSN